MYILKVNIYLLKKVELIIIIMRKLKFVLVIILFGRKVSKSY